MSQRKIPFLPGRRIQEASSCPPVGVGQTEVWREIELMIAKSAGKQRKVADRDATVRSADFQTHR